MSHCQPAQETETASFDVSVESFTSELGAATISFSYRNESSHVFVSIDKFSSHFLSKPDDSMWKTNISIEHNISLFPMEASNYIKLFIQNVLESTLLLDPFYTQTMLTCRVCIFAGTSIHSILVGAINALSVVFLNSGIPLYCSFFALLSIETVEKVSHTTLFIVNQNGQLIIMDGPSLPSQHILKQQLDCSLLPKFRQILTQ